MIDHLKALINNYPDSLRYPIVKENVTWEEVLIPSLEEMLNMAAQATTKEDMKFMRNLFGVFLEIVYIKGMEYAKENQGLV